MITAAKIAKLRYHRDGSDRVLHATKAKISAALKRRHVKAR